MKNKIALLGAMLMLMLAGSAFSSAAAAQDPPAIAAANCPGSIVSADTVVVGSARAGAVQLCKDSSGRYFGYIVKDSSMPSGHFGTAVMIRHLNGFPIDGFACDGSGGNLHIAPGQTSCRTAPISAPSSSVTFHVEGWICNTPTYTRACLVGFGHTQRTR